MDTPAVVGLAGNYTLKGFPPIAEVWPLCVADLQHVLFRLHVYCAGTVQYEAAPRQNQLPRTVSGAFSPQSPPDTTESHV